MRKLSDIDKSDGIHVYGIYLNRGEIHIASCIGLANAVLITLLLNNYHTSLSRLQPILQT